MSDAAEGPPGRRGLLGLGAACLLLRSGPSGAATGYPDRPVRLIVPYAAGSSTDTVARVVADGLGEVLGQRFVVDNRGGAGGLLASQAAARAAPDGYTMILAGSTLVANAHLHADPGYDPLRDFAPAVRIAGNATVLAAGAASPFRTAGELIGAARARPGGLSYGSSGVGTPAHLSAAAFLKGLGAAGVHVPYRGANQIVLALMQGEIDFASPVLDAALGRIRDGSLRAFATSGAERSTLLPELPTVAELVPGTPPVTTWVSLLLPAGTPPEILARLSEATHRAAGRPAFTEALARSGTELILSADPASFRRFVEEEYDRIGRIVAMTGARAE